MSNSGETTIQEYTSIDEIPRYQAPNPYNYDELTLAKRATEIKAAMKDYPMLSEHTIAMAWDTTNSLGEERMTQIIKNKEWEKKREDRPKAGAYATVTIEDQKNEV